MTTDQLIYLVVGGAGLGLFVAACASYLRRDPGSPPGPRTRPNDTFGDVPDGEWPAPKESDFDETPSTTQVSIPRSEPPKGEPHPKPVIRPENRGQKRESGIHVAGDSQGAFALAVDRWLHHPGIRCTLLVAFTTTLTILVVILTLGGPLLAGALVALVAASTGGGYVIAHGGWRHMHARRLRATEHNDIAQRDERRG